MNKKMLGILLSASIFLLSFAWPNNGKMWRANITFKDKLGKPVVLTSDLTYGRFYEPINRFFYFGKIGTFKVLGNTEYTNILTKFMDDNKSKVIEFQIDDFERKSGEPIPMNLKGKFNLKRVVDVEHIILNDVTNSGIRKIKLTFNSSFKDAGFQNFSNFNRHFNDGFTVNLENID